MKSSKSEAGTHSGNNFEIKTHHSNEYLSNIRDFLARLCNTFSNALSSTTKLPKAIIVVLDDDLIQYANIDNFGMSIVYGRLTHYLLSEFNRLLTIKKESMPHKAVRPNYPHILWINPPTHCNFLNNTRGTSSRRFLITLLLSTRTCGPYCSKRYGILRTTPSI